MQKEHPTNVGWSTEMEQTDSKNEKKPEKGVEKVVPSPIEKLLDHVVHKSLGPIVPKWMSPNMVTGIGAIGGAIGIVFALLSRMHPLFLIGTCCGIITHLVCDNLDGFVARQRNSLSNRGAYFDLLTDILHITYLLIALTFAGVMHWYITIFLVPVYALIIFTSMNEIHYLNRFSFPTVGPAETHLFFIAIMVGSMITSCKVLLTLWGVDFTFGDLVCLVGGIPLYVEMIRLQITVYLRIRKKDKEAEAERNKENDAQGEA